MQFCSWILKFVPFSELLGQFTKMKQNIVGDSWKGMLWSFRELVSQLYSDWNEYLLDSLSPADQRYFESIRANEAPEEQWISSLLRLCKFWPGNPIEKL